MNVLLLQGPLGPFFSKLHQHLAEAGHNCWRVAFNGGDLFQSPWSDQTLVYRDSPDNWSEWLIDLCFSKKITHVFVYGDCRFYHREAKQVCERLNVEFYAFEEGYIRPNYITFEKSGVNGNSKIQLEDVQQWAIRPWPRVENVRWAFYAQGLGAIGYYIAMALSRPFFKNYKHHRNDSASRDAIGYLRSACRKLKYSFKDKRTWKKFKDKNYFVAPLQVSYDSQIHFHSPFNSVEEFIEQTMESFSKYSNSNDLLVFKHHPADRGNNNYGKFIKFCEEQYDLKDRVLYVHDLNLPKLLKKAKGVVTVNSTSAISAFHHGAPVKILGNTFYNMPGLSDQSPLNEFWQSPTPASKELYLKLRNYLEYHSQITGSFYSLPRSTSKLVLEKWPQRQDSVVYPDMIVDI